MKRIIIIGSLLLLCSSVFGQTSIHATTIKILPKSTLSITGDTNINKFLCSFNTELIAENNHITYQPGDSKIYFQNAILKLDNSGFDCGNKAINKDFKNLIKAEEYPEISLELEEIILTDIKKAFAKVIIKIAGETNTYTVPVEITSDETIQYKGSLDLNISDFKLHPPKKMFGLIVIREDININFILKVKNKY